DYYCTSYAGSNTLF
nr:immunoglobulin light chain junction region [Macaca mulatta]MOX45891.1 immunoglobulin light chain junction region [Macaca mulatta]